MGTRKISANPKKTMTHVFRGLLDILHQNHAQINKDIISHIRSFDREPSDQEAEINVIGFWRMLLELIFNCYTQTTKIMGITLVFVLVVLSYPLRLVSTLLGGMWFSRRVMLTEEELQQYYINHMSNEAKPTDIKDVDSKPVTEQSNEGKVVRRVVYEEAKVTK
jgi:hypothetical protein